MPTISGLLTSLDHRFGRFGAALLLLLALVLAVAVGLTMAGVTELLLTTAEPVQVAPVRWIYRA